MTLQGRICVSAICFRGEIYTALFHGDLPAMCESVPERVLIGPHSG